MSKPNPTVNNLRAMFEQNQDATSPPSRGRSPAGPETLIGDSSRPISKVRTSFVSVERIGPMGPFNGVKKSSDNAEQDVGATGGSESKGAATPVPPQISKLNGNGVLHSPSKAETKDETSEGDGKVTEGQNNAELSTLDNSKTPINVIDNTVDKSDPAGKTDSPQTSNLKDDESKLETSNPAEEPQDLGAILKGAPFEHEVGENVNLAEGQEPAGPESTPSPRQPSELVSEVSGSPSKPEAAAKPTSKPKPKPGSSRPSAIIPKKTSDKAPKPGATASNGVSAGSPKTPNSPNVAGRQPLSKTASPRQSGPSKAPKPTDREPRKEPVARTNRLSVGTKVPEAAGTKSQKGVSAPNGNSTKKPGPISPITKARPKSPTRSVRLPAAATAPTASSAAKVGDVPPSRSPSRSSVNNARKPAVLGRDRAAPSSNARRSTPRTSLPAASNESQKPKARVSTSSAKAPEGSFLARMMRPTQSSASKTHEKVEHAVTKAHPARPKRKSGGSEEDPKGPSPEEAPSTLQQGDEDATTPGSVPAEDVVNGTEEASTDVTAPS
ncbi:hypothetical protein MMC07_006040 [Pseudocyphellaria aurata]|nr:hypothetical protein [Pseudocyphellaria aurata]